MKKLIVFVTLLLCTALYGIAGHAPVKIVSTKDAFMYLKVDKTMMGGVLEVRDGRDSLIETIALKHHKIYVDFYYKSKGRYKIHLQKNDVSVEFEYELAEPVLPEANTPEAHAFGVDGKSSLT